MIGRPVPNGAYRGDYPPYFDITRPVEALTIAFVRMEGRWVTGVLDPYLDPESGLDVVTIFRGRLEGDRISGEYVTTVRSTGEESTGRWTAHRKAGKVVDQGD
jgi:hypothetical protein